MIALVLTGNWKQTVLIKERLTGKNILNRDLESQSANEKIREIYLLKRQSFRRLINLLSQILSSNKQRQCKESYSFTSVTTENK